MNNARQAPRKKGLTNFLWYAIIILPQMEALFFCAFLREAYENSELPGGAVMRVKITLACTECKQRTYNTMKNKKNDPDRLEMHKYCRFCKKHTTHKETK